MPSELAEIQRDLGKLTGMVEQGFEGTHRRHDTTNGRIGKIEEKVAQLIAHQIKDRSDIDVLQKGSAGQQLTVSYWTNRAIHAVLFVFGSAAVIVLVKLRIVDPDLFR